MTTEGVPDFVVVREAIEKLAGELEAAGSRLQDQLGERFNVVTLVKRFRQKVSNEGFYVAMFGAHGTGKSAFLNQVMGERILKEDVPATTSALVFLAKGESRSAFVQFKPIVAVHVVDGGRFEVEAAHAARAWLAEEADSIRRVTLKTAAGPPKEISPAEAAEMLTDALGPRADAEGDRAGDGFRKVETTRHSLPRDMVVEFEFEVAEPMTFDLEEAESLNRFQSYSSDLDKAMLVDLITVEHPSDRLEGVTFVDTPGLSSLVQYHRLTTREFVREADGLIVFLDARIPSLRNSDRRTASELAEWLEGRRNQVVYFVANFADRLAARGKLLGLDEPGTMDLARREMTSAISAVLTRGGWTGFNPDRFFLVDSSRGANVAEVIEAVATDVSARKSLVLEENWRRHLLGYVGTISGIAEAHLERLREIRSGHHGKQREFRDKAAAVERAVEEVKTTAAGLIGDVQKETADYFLDVESTVDGLERKKDFERFLKGWPECRSDLVERVQQSIARGGDRITRIAEEGIREGVSQKIQLPAPSLDMHRYVLPEDQVLAPLGGFWWGLKCILAAILPWRLTRKNVARARAGLAEAMVRVREEILKDASDQVDKVREVADLYLEDARTVLDSTRRLEQQYRDDAQAASEKIRQLEAVASSLDGIGRQVGEVFSTADQGGKDETPGA